MSEEESTRFLAVARILRPRGRSGEVAAEIITDFPERFRAADRVYLESHGQPPRSASLEKAWPHKGQIILKFSGVDSIEAASRLRDCHVLVPIDEKFPLPENAYYWHELIGCRVIMSSAGHAQVGKVTAVEPTGGVALLHVALCGANEKEALIPLAQAICTKIDIQAREIVIDPPEDLLDLNVKT